MSEKIKIQVNLLIWCVLCFTLFNGGLGQVEDEKADDGKQPEIYFLHVRSEIMYHFATTLIQSHVVNPSVLPREVVFDVTLPNEAFISNFTLEIDDVLYNAIVKEKDEIKPDFEQAQAQGQSAGLLSQKPRDTNRFKIAVPVAAQSKVKFNVTYQELLQRVRGVYRHTIYIDPGQPVKDLRIDVAIHEYGEIKTLRVPPITNTDLLTNDVALEENTIAVITNDLTSALINYVPSVAEQTKSSVDGLSGQFVVEYDVKLGYGLDAGKVIHVKSKDYFVHFISPKVQTTISKDVLFILDCSGSMSGTKIKQLKEGMLIIMDELHAGDRFNIIKFTSDTKLFKSTMIQATPATIEEAKAYITSEIEASGTTNINDALLVGINQQRISQIIGIRSPSILFLTDGKASDGETSTTSILENVKEGNKGCIPIFSLALGADADWDLINKLAIQNNGIARKIYEDSDAALQIARFYEELAVTLLNDVTVKYLDYAVDEESLTKSKFKTYFLGSEMVVAGRSQDVNDLDLQINATSSEGVFKLNGYATSGRFVNNTGLITNEEKTWAYLTIKQLLRQADGTTYGREKNTFIEKALELSLKYNFVTPLTSLVVIKPENETNGQQINTGNNNISVYLQGDDRNNQKLFNKNSSEKKAKAISSCGNLTSPFKLIVACLMTSIWYLTSGLLRFK